MNGASLNPEANPYLAHMYENDASNGYSNGYDARSARQSGPLSAMKRHQTTSKLARAAEDGPFNPFTGSQLSEQYFRILKTRRNLPVHAQR